jgi:3-oxoacyl-[acyl-carrier protein] reductase
MDPAKLAKQMESVPLGRQGLPDEVAAAIAFLASADAGYITGQCLHVNGRTESCEAAPPRRSPERVM